MSESIQPKQPFTIFIPPADYKYNPSEENSSKSTTPRQHKDSEEIPEKIELKARKHKKRSENKNRKSIALQTTPTSSEAQNKTVAAKSKTKNNKSSEIKTRQNKQKNKKAKAKEKSSSASDIENKPIEKGDFGGWKKYDALKSQLKKLEKETGVVEKKYKKQDEKHLKAREKKALDPHFDIDSVPQPKKLTDLIEQRKILWAQQRDLKKEIEFIGRYDQVVFSDSVHWLYS